MKIERHPDAASFLARAGEFLLADDPVNQMVYGIAARVRDGLFPPGDAPFYLTVGHGEEVALAALRTPPYNLAMSGGSVTAAEALGETLAAGSEEVPGVAGPRVPAEAFAATYTALRGLVAEERTAQALYTVERVVEPRPGPGAMRTATEGDRELLARWFGAFDEEAVGDGVDGAKLADRHLRASTARLYEDDEPVCMLGSTRVTPRAVRIGYVYTPPELRGRGYASRLVADATREALDAGREYVCLFTDLANPTSNGIYRALGYRPVAEFTLTDFEAVTPRGTSS